MQNFDVLAINTYAGSLLLGAEDAGFKVRGSYEDTGFGSAIPKANFPGLNFIDQKKDWPAQDLSSTIVAAHPPCSAFSTMNSSPTAKATRGVDSSAFACTKSVLRYAMTNQAAAVTVESVMGAAKGAAAVHEGFAQHYGYDLYRLFLNSITFGVPQWRNRFWAIFVKRGLTPTLTVGLTPRYRSLREVLEGQDPGDPIKVNDRFWREQQDYLRGGERMIRTHTPMPQKIRARKTFTAGQVKDLIDGRLGYGTVPGLAARMLEPGLKKPEWKRYDRNHGGFTCQWMNVLDPDLYAPVLLGAAWWGCCGRNLCENDYKRIMGFPDDYLFPAGHHKDNIRMYLSKGVVPAVAAHVLSMIRDNLRRDVEDGKFSQTSPPGSTFYFRISKKDWRNLDPKFKNTAA